MNIFGMGLPEMVLIMVLALLVFGPKKLPEIGRSMGKAIRGFKEASQEFESEFKREAEDLQKAASMEATLEPKQPQALSSAASAEVAEVSKDAEPAVVGETQPAESPQA
ncbi:MAG: TatA/E family twin arginine-targeting protein translocase [Cyanobacteria bacterium P01_H01_bin.121]